jgi:hypothetical protein
VVAKLLGEAPDKFELISTETGNLSAELDFLLVCHMASESPLPPSPTRDQDVVSHNQEIAESGPRPTNASIGQELRRPHAPDSAALHHEPPHAVPIHHSSNEAPYRRPSSPNPMNIQNLLHGNAIHEDLLDTSDIQPSKLNRTRVQLSPATTSQSQLAANISMQNTPCDQELLQPSLNPTSDQHPHDNPDISKTNSDKDLHASDGEEFQSFDKASEPHSPQDDDNSLEGHIPNEIQDGAVRLLSIMNQWRDKTQEEETVLREKEGEEEDREEGEAQQVEREEDGEKDNNGNNGHDDMAQKETKSGKNNKKVNSSVQEKESKYSMRARGKKAVFPTERSSARESKRDSKRKSSSQEVVDNRSKRSKTRVSTGITDIGSLKGLEHIPKDTIQPAEVYKIFINRSQSEDHDGMWLLTRLFFAIASPDAFYQLRDACTSVRENNALTILPSTNSIAQTIQALDSLEIAASTNSVLRRYHLTRLVDHRNERESHHKDQQSERALRSVKDSSEGYGRASSKALTDLMAQAYPELKPPQRGRGRSEDEYQRRLKSLKNRIGSGRNWNLMQQKFSPGILALVPTGGEYNIQNSE